MKKIALDEFCRLKYLSRPTFSPDGKHFCFVMSSADKAKNAYVSYLYELKGKTVRQLTSGGKERSFFFLDDGTLLFAGDRENEKEPFTGSRFYRLPLNGGEATLAYEFPISVDALWQLKNGDLLLTGDTVPGYEDLYKGDKKRLEAYRKATKENEDYEIVDRLPWWWNGQGFTKGVYTSLYCYETKKKKLRRLTPENFSVYDVRLNRDRTDAWFFGSECRPYTPAGEGGDLYRMKIADGSMTLIAKETADFAVQYVEPADSFLYVVATDKKHGLNSDGDFYTLSYEDNTLTPLLPFGEAIGSSVGSDVRYGGGRSVKAVGDTLYFITTLYDGSYLYKLENGTLTRLTEAEGSVDCFDVAGDRIRTVALRGMLPQEIYDENDKPLTSFNARLVKDRYIAEPETLNVTTQGHDVHGFVLRPFGWESGKKYPVILDIHGGPKTVYGPVFYHEMQYWASLGYYVIFCNPTGSDGRNAFADIRGKYGTTDYDDIMAFCDKALEAYPDMDSANFFETGGSYGGFMTNWIIGHTDRFAACASQRSISNWFSFYGTSDIGVGFGTDQNGADPWNDPEKLRWHSPLKYADRCKTPTLFIHSFEDYRCPIEQGYQMYAALVSHGVEAKMVLFKGENHELSRSGKPLHRIKRLDEITKWFEAHKR